MAFPQIADDPELTSTQWWEAHRRQYNLALLAIGIPTLLLYIPLLGIDAFPFPPAISVLHFLGFPVLFGLANVYYFLGAFLEEIVRPQRRTEFRRAAYQLGFWFSCAMTFLFCFPGFIIFFVIGPAAFFRMGH